MAGKKKGSPKTGGRVKGTPNKVTAFSKATIAKMIADYSDSGKMSLDFDSLDPKDRLQIAEKMMQYVMPKIQSVEVDIASEKPRTIEDMLIELAEEESNKSK